ncbi:MAG: hypothetical protein ACI4B9_02480 [Eggerthellaceae bacterium]
MAEGQSDTRERSEAAGGRESAREEASQLPLEASGGSGTAGDALSDAFDDGEWEYVYEDELEEGDVWEYLDEDGRDTNPLSYRNMQNATDDLNSIYREGVAVAREMKGAVEDIKGLFDLKGLFKL